MSTITELSATASLSVLAAIILFCCCFYYFLSRKQREREEPDKSRRVKKGWFTTLRSPFSSRRSSLDSALPHSRSISTCSQQTLNLAELVKAMEEQQQHIEKENKKLYCSSEYRIAMLMPGSHSIQEKQERFHRWLSTPSCHLTPIKEEVNSTQTNNNDDRRLNAETRAFDSLPVVVISPVILRECDECRRVDMV